MRRILLLTVIAVSALGLLGAGDMRRFEKLGHELICTCGCNQILLECNHVGCPSSSAMRDELTAELKKANADNDAVLQTFVTKYGPTVLAAPTTTGFNRVAWVMPFAVFVTGIVAVVMVTRVWKQRTPTVAGPARVNDDLRSRIRQETEQ